MKKRYYNIKRGFNEAVESAIKQVELTYKSRKGYADRPKLRYEDSSNYRNLDGTIHRFLLEHGSKLDDVRHAILFALANKPALSRSGTEKLSMQISRELNKMLESGMHPRQVFSAILNAHGIDFGKGHSETDLDSIGDNAYARGSEDDVIVPKKTSPLLPKRPQRNILVPKDKHLKFKNDLEGARVPHEERALRNGFTPEQIWKGIESGEQDINGPEKPVFDLRWIKGAPTKPNDHAPFRQDVQVTAVQPDDERRRKDWSSSNKRLRRVAMPADVAKFSFFA